MAWPKALVVALLLLWPRVGWGLPVDPGDTQAEVWVPLRIIAPATRARLERVTPLRAYRYPEGVVVEGTKGVAFWLAAGERAVVRAEPSVPLGYWRREVAQEGEGTVFVEARAEPADDEGHLVTQPPSHGGLWWISAERRARVWISVASDRRPQLVAEKAEEEVLSWIEHGGTFPRLPFGARGPRLERRMLAELEVARRLAAQVPSASGQDLARRWRRASAIDALLGLRPLLRPALVAQEVTHRIEGLTSAPLTYEALSRSPPGRHLRWTTSNEAKVPIEVVGEGVLRVRLRALARNDTGEMRATVSCDGVVLAGTDVPLDPARFDDLDGAIVPPQRREIDVPGVGRLAVPVELQVATFPGRHRYLLQISGGRAIVEVEWARRVPRWVRRFEGRGRRRPEFDAEPEPFSLAQEVLEELLGAYDRPMWPRAPPMDGSLDDTVSAYLWTRRAAQEGLAKAARLEGAILALEWLRRVTGPKREGPADDRVVSFVRAVLVEVFAQLGRQDLVHASLATLDTRIEEPAPESLVAWARLADVPTHRGPSRALAAGDAALRSSGRDEAIERLARAAWRKTVWSRRTPVFDRGEAPVASLTFVEPTQSEATRAPVVAASAGEAVWDLPPGPVHEVLAPAPPRDDPGFFVLRLFVYAREKTTEPEVRIQVDDQTFETALFRGAEVFEIAVSPGPHRVRVAGPTDLRVLSNTPSLRDPFAKPVPRSRMWSLTRARPLTFDVGPGDVLTYARIDVRRRDVAGDGGAAGEAGTLRVRPDVGPPFRLELQVPGHGSRALGLDASGPVGPRVESVVEFSPLVKRVTVELERGPNEYFVSLSVRRPGKEAGAEGTPTGSGSRVASVGGPRGVMSIEDALLTEVAACTRSLLAHPDDHAARARRAEALLDLGSRVEARSDLMVLVLAGPTLDEETRLILERLLHRFLEEVSPDFVRLPGQPTAPLLLFPPLVKGGAAPSVREAKTAWATGQPAVAARGLLDAFRAYGDVALGYGAFRAYAAALEGTEGEVPSLSDTALAYGVSKALLARVDAGWLRRVSSVFAGQSRVSPPLGAEASAGYEVLRQEGPSPPTDLSARVRRGLVSPPWNESEGVFVSNGRSTVLELQVVRPEVVTAKIWCRDLGPPSEARGTVALVSLALDDDRGLRREIPLDVVVEHPFPAVTGLHRFEVAVLAQPVERSCAVRFESSKAPGHAIDATRSERSVIAMPDAAVRYAVEGPAVFEVEIRADLGLKGGGIPSPAPMRATVTLRHGGVASEQIVQMPLEEDENVSIPERPETRVGRSATVSLLLWGRGPATVEVVPHAGAVFVRGRLRYDQVAPSRERVDLRVLAESSPAVVPWGSPLRQAEHLGGVGRGPPRPGFGTVAAAVTYSTDGLDDVDDLSPRSRVAFQSSLRRELLDDRLWVVAKPELRLREASPAAGGLTLGFAAVGLPLGLRARIFGRFDGQSTTIGLAHASRLTAEVDRIIPVTPRLDLRLAVQTGVRRQSMDRIDAIAPAVLAELHPEVYTAYVTKHPFVFTPEVMFRFRPVQYQMLSAGLSATPNSDFGSLDHVDAEARWVGLVDLPRWIVPAYELSYQASVRLPDADRPVGFVRHRVLLETTWTVWAGRVGRFGIGGRDQLYLSSAFPIRNVLEVFAFFDLALGRGMRDMSPMEQAFRDYYGPDLWAPGRWESDRWAR